ncbi:uncharacterized protein LOC133895182 [Phragmites australis]|uniref:uncharacterized protein LOC133895182 n=1 Tax=Phragmites australis TaxID=29695 RepID=UPI002D792128|nr:uncharacterized protein LOC133895182 [Phragmites australis]
MGHVVGPRCELPQHGTQLLRNLAATRQRRTHRKARCGRSRRRRGACCARGGGEGAGRWTTPGHEGLPKGYLFNRPPPPPGESQKWENWELPFYVTSFLTRRHPWRRPQRQARSHPRDLGAPECTRAPPATGASRRRRVICWSGRVPLPFFSNGSRDLIFTVANGTGCANADACVVWWPFQPVRAFTFQTLLKRDSRCSDTVSLLTCPSGGSRSPCKDLSIQRNG